MYIGTANLTAAASVMADDLTIDGAAFDHNAVLARGPQNTCGGNATSYVSAAGVFDGSMNNPGTALLTNGTFTYNYMDTSGSYFTWYHLTSNGSAITNTTWTSNVDTGTGNPCN
jgi:hypothetical protein